LYTLPHYIFSHRDAIIARKMLSRAEDGGQVKAESSKEQGKRNKEKVRR